MSSTAASSATSSRSVFLTGATGYIGGQFLQQLLSAEKDYAPSKITTLHRSEAKTQPLKSLSTSQTEVKPVQGSFTDFELLTRLVEEHDITIETADSDDPKMMEAVLEGMKRRKQQGKETIFIHTSGTGTLTDDARGMHPMDTIWTDDKPLGPNEKNINDLPISAFHRKIDLAITDADAKGWCKSYIILPGTVWGDGSGKVVDAGVANASSKQIPQQAEASLDRGQAGMVGKGLNVWPHVHIDDVASHFTVVYKAALADSAPHGIDGYFIATAGEYRLLEATQAIGETLHAVGKSKTAEPSSFTEDELTKYYGAIEKIGGTKYYSGTNSRGKSAQATKLGWVPKHADVAEFYEYCRAETRRLAKA